MLKKNAKEHIGGLVSRSNSKIENCFVIGNIVGSSFAGRPIGLLVGTSNDEMINCYAIGNVAGNNNVGGIGFWFNRMVNNIGNHSFPLFSRNDTTGRYQLYCKWQQGNIVFGIFDLDDWVDKPICTLINTDFIDGWNFFCIYM